MANKNIHMDELSLQPMDMAPDTLTQDALSLEISASESAFSTGKSTFQVESRENKQADRRQQIERRNEVRMQEDRRCHISRRENSDQWDDLHRQ
ncbi:MAG: hypothetical protein HRU20_23995 [Pseudomonadales bacterium]|nr:hypothetical protein [Pseudomonadales bacterium]